jgi:diguanylate cyclase (GGDEF)-like protein/PAS domain S-box-containing protein
MRVAKLQMQRADDVPRYARELEQVLEQIGEAVIVKDLNAIVTYWNREAASLYGFSAQEAVGQPLRKLHAMDLSDADYARLLERIRAGKPTSTTTERMKKSGEFLRVTLKTTPLLDTENNLVGEITVARDVTALHRQEESLRAAQAKLADRNEALRIQVKKLLASEEMVHVAEQRLRSVADNVPALIGYWNRELVCEYANNAYCEWFGLSPGQVEGTSMRDLLGDRVFRIVESHARLALKGQPQCFEVALQNRSGSDSYLEVRYIPDRGETEGVMRGFYVLKTDITTFRNVQMALETANSQLANNNLTDYLTELANRRAFREQCEEAAKRLRKYGEEFGLILLDLDNFKQINDSFGHETGDDVLRAVSKLLRKQLRNQRDVAARLAGDAFAILCFGAFDEELLCAVAEGVRALIKQETIRSGHGVVQVTVSLGVAIGDVDDTNWMAIYSRAESALQEAKAAGKDRMILCKARSKEQQIVGKITRTAPK